MILRDPKLFCVYTAKEVTLKNCFAFLLSYNKVCTATVSTWTAVTLRSFKMEMVLPFQHNPRVIHNKSSYLSFNKGVHPLKHSLTGKFIGQVRVNLWRQCVKVRGVFVSVNFMVYSVPAASVPNTPL